MKLNVLWVNSRLRDVDTFSYFKEISSVREHSTVLWAKQFNPAFYAQIYLKQKTFYFGKIEQHYIKVIKFMTVKKKNNNRLIIKKNTFMTIYIKKCCYHLPYLNVCDINNIVYTIM